MRQTKIINELALKIWVNLYNERKILLNENNIILS
jgi:hypothetical protein